MAGHTAAPPLDRSAGWKLDPLNDDRLRFWDGHTWTEAIKDAGEDVDLYVDAEAQARNVKEPTSTAAVLGWVFVFIAPLIGFFIGLALIAKGDRWGAWVTFMAVVMGFVYLTLLASAAGV